MVCDSSFSLASDERASIRGASLSASALLLVLEQLSSPRIALSILSFACADSSLGLLESSFSGESVILLSWIASLTRPCCLGSSSVVISAGIAVPVNAVVISVGIDRSWLNLMFHLSSF